MRNVVILLGVLGGWASAAAAQTPSDVNVTMMGLKAVVTWTGIPDRGNQNGGYELRFSRDPLTPENFLTADVAGNTSDPNDPTQYRAVVTFTDWGTTYFLGLFGNMERSYVFFTASTEPAPDLTAPAAVVLSASASSGTVLLAWTAPGNDGNSGRAALYDLRYSLQPIDSSTWAAAVKVSGLPWPAMAGVSQSFSINGLGDGRTYHFALRTADQVPNWSDLSNSASLTVVPDLTPPGQIVDLAITAITEDLISLGWTAPGDDDAVGTAAGYELRYSTAGPIQSDSDFASATPVPGLPAPAPAGSAQQVTVTGLSPNTTYHLALRAGDESFQWSARSMTSGTTLQPEGSIGNTKVCSAAVTGSPLQPGGIVFLAFLFLLRKR